MPEIIRIDARDAEVYGRAMELSDDELGGAVSTTEVSDPALVFIINHRPIAMVGFIPTALLSGTAYGWMQWSMEIHQHRVTTARTMFQVLREMQRIYPRIVGHCAPNSRAEHWFRRLGARFDTDLTGKPTFMLGSF
jgi:hypothetical protein